MALTEKEFFMIKKKMDKIDQRLDELYKNWHAEYGNTNTKEECEEIKNFYKPYLEKYELKYRVLLSLTTTTKFDFLPKKYFGYDS